MSEARPRLSEDWLAVWGGLLIFTLSLGVLVGVDLLGWGVKTQVWVQLADALVPVSKTYAALPGIAVAGWQLTSFCSWQPRSAHWLCGFRSVRSFAGSRRSSGISYACWIAGSYAYIAATPDKVKSFGIPWSLNLTAEAGFMIALIAGLVVGNVFPPVCGIHQDGDPARMVHQDRDCHPGRSPWDRRSGAMGIGESRDVPRTVRDRRSVSDLLGAGLLCGAEVLQVQPRMGRPLGLRHFHLRCLGGHCHRRGDPGAAGRADHGVVAGGDLRGGGVAGPTLRGATLPLSRTDGCRCVDGTGRENRRGSRRGRSDGGFPDPRQSPSGGRRELPGRLDHGHGHDREGVHRRLHRSSGPSSWQRFGVPRSKGGRAIEFVWSRFGSDFPSLSSAI